MELREVLKKFREENGLSQREFAKRCELSNSLISILEMGVNPQTGKKASPDLITYKKLAYGMGITVQSLFEMLDETERIALSISDFEPDLDEKPKNNDVRLLLQEMNRMTPEQIEQVKGMFMVMFKKNEKGTKEDDA
jgi:transcriptional regulator with XRE-family HTH domain